MLPPGAWSILAGFRAAEKDRFTWSYFPSSFKRAHISPHCECAFHVCLTQHFKPQGVCTTAADICGELSVTCSHSKDFLEASTYVPDVHLNCGKQVWSVYFVPFVLAFTELQWQICRPPYARYQVRSEGCAFRLQQLGLRILMRSTFSLQTNEWELKFFQFSEDKALCEVLIKTLSDGSFGCDVGLCMLGMCPKKATVVSSAAKWQRSERPHS